MRAIKRGDNEWSIELGEGQESQLHSSLFQLFVEVTDVRCEWSAQKVHLDDACNTEHWEQYRIIRGSGTMPLRGITIIQADGNVESLLSTLEVNIFGLDASAAPANLGEVEFKRPIGSHLRHWEETAASCEDQALPEHLYLAIAVPEKIFEVAWNELQMGGSSKRLEVCGRFECLNPVWPDQHFIRAGSLLEVVQEEVLVLTKVQ